MFGWTKKEKNEKSLNRARAELGKLSPKDKGKKLSRFRKKYPTYVNSEFEFDDYLFDFDLVLMYLLLCDELAVEEADLYDNPVEAEEPMDETVDKVDEEMVEVAVAAEVADEVVTAEAEEITSFDSETPVKSTPSYSPEPETTSFDSDTSRSSYGGGDDSYGGGGSSFDSGGGDCGGGDD